MENRVLSEKDLERMSSQSLERLMDLIDAGERDAAKRQALSMYREFKSMHDDYRDWVTSLLGEVNKRWGYEALEEVMIETVGQWWIPNVENIRAKAGDDIALAAKMFSGGLRGHLQPIEVTEDDEKITFCMKPCGSGGCQVLDGKYEGEDAFTTLKGPSKLTYGRDEFPIYCAHEAAMEQADIEANGFPFLVVEPGETIGEDHCKFHAYKNPADIPERYFTRLGLKKPEAF